MANLKALREKIKNITDYSPDLQQYNDQLDELINDSYYNIWTLKRWSFATKEYLFKFIPDMVFVLHCWHNCSHFDCFIEHCHQIFYILF